MALALAPGLALLGGSLFGKIGFGVGWLIGSWLYQPEQQDRNEIIDPGAQEMPRFNQSLRGITMPILFGTNRVSSQLIWQNNFQTIRKETTETQGGGKSGGSGGGKGPTSSTTTATYEYKWDIIYHAGMPPLEYQLFGGWLGTERLADSTILAISQGTGAVQGSLDNDRPQNASLSFEEAFFYNGDGPGIGSGIGSWDHVVSVLPGEIRWPHTCWVGFKQLDLGETPHVPQLSWEIGPGAPEFSFDSEGRFYTTGLSQNLWSTCPSPCDKWGTSYWMDGRFSDSDNTQLDFDGNIEYKDLRQTAIETALTAFYGSPVSSDRGWTVNPVHDGEYAIVVYCAQVHTHVAVYATENGGTDFSDDTKILGAVFCGHNLNQEESALYSFLAGNQTLDDPIMVVTNTGDANSGLRLIQFPSINAIINGDFTGANGWKGTIYDVNGNTSSFSQHEVPHLIFAFDIPTSGPTNWDGTPGFCIFNSGITSLITGGGGDLSYDCLIVPMPKANIGVGGVTYNTRCYFYLSKACMNRANSIGTGVEFIDDDLGPTYPNGGMFYFDFGERSVFDAPSSTSSKVNTITITSYGEHNSLVDGMPLTDEEIGLDDSANTINYYDMIPYIEKLENGGYIFALHMKFTDQSDQDIDGDGNAEALYVRVKAWLYNPFTEKFTSVISGGGYTISTSFAGISEGANNWWIASSHIWRDARDNSLYLVGNRRNNGSGYPIGGVHNYIFMVKIGTLNITGGGDVTPPYIIYQILTNGWFGLNIDTASIDTTSYQEAVLYCEANEFFVSTQYRREENVLDIIEDLLSLYGGFLVIVDGKIYFKVLEFEQTPVRTIDNDHLVQEQPGQPPVKITQGAKQDTFNSVKVNYIDRALDYEQNQVEESDEVDQDLDRIRVREYPPRYVMREKMARTMASRTLWGNLYARDTYEFALGWKDADLAPGDVITLVDSFHTSLQSGITARIVQWQERKRGKFDVVAKQEFQYIAATSADALDITSQSYQNIIEKIPPPRDFTMYELPAEFTTDGALFVGWQPWGFAAGATLYVSGDGETYAAAQKASPYCLAGTIITELPNVPEGSTQENVEVLLFPNSDWPTTTSYNLLATLQEAGQATRAVGGSLIWIGSEMIAYEGVNLVGQNRYIFDTVWRGWGGTNIQNHTSGDLWHKHGGGIFTQEINVDKIGQTIYYKVAPYNLAGFEYDISSIDAKTYSILGSYWRPQSAPTPRFVNSVDDWRGLTKIKVGSGSDITLEWRDSARLAGFGVGGYGTGTYGRFTTDSHDWRVEVIGSGDVVVRSISVDTPAYTYVYSENQLDNGAWRPNVSFNVTPYNQYGDALRTEVLSLELFP